MLILIMTVLVLTLPIMGEVYQKGSDNIITHSSEEVAELVNDVSVRIRKRIAYRVAMAGTEAATQALREHSDLISLRVLQIVLHVLGWVLRAAVWLIKSVTGE
jgi:hypothetical protein